MRVIEIIACVLLLGCGDDGAPADAAADSSAPDAQDSAMDVSDGGMDGLVWSPCDGGECAELVVPVDYENPDSLGTLTLSVFRHAAVADRIGTLVVAAGSGSSSTQRARQLLRQAIPAMGEVVRRFDIVGIDLRGLPSSEPQFRCLPDILARAQVLRDLRDAADDDARIAVAETAIALCLENTSENLGYFSTASRVQDIDRLRELLGEEQISLIGGSYGTWTISAYAMRYPDRVRAALLWSALTMGHPFDRVESAARGSDIALGEFLDWCDGDLGCAFRPPTGTSREAFDALVSSIAATPLVSALGELDAYVLGNALSRALYLPDYSAIAEALDAAESGNPNMILAQAGFTDDDERDLVEHMLDLQPPAGTTLADWRTRLAALQGELTSFGPLVTAYDPRIVFSLAWTDRPVPLVPQAIPSAPPFLILAGDADPVTPLAGQQELQTLLNNDSVILDTQIVGHIVLARPCPLGRAQTYLLDPATLEGGAAMQACPERMPDETVVGTVSAEFLWGGAADGRLVETALGNLVTDAIRAESGAQIALINGGSYRTALPSDLQPADTALRRPAAGYAMGPPFDIVVDDVLATLPFGNRIASTELTGAEVWDILEFAVSNYDGMPQGRFVQVSGLSFMFDPSAASGSRVTAVTLDGGTAIANDDSATYTVAVPDFFWYGGTGYTGFLAERPTLGATMDEALVNYFIANSRDMMVDLVPATSGRIQSL